MSFFTRRKVEDPRDTRIGKLEEENEALVASAAKLRDHYRREHQRQQDRIDALTAFKHRLETELDAANGTIARGLDEFRQKQAELDRALAEVKRLDAKLVQVDCENLRLSGELATAEERLAGYQKAVA